MIANRTVLKTECREVKQTNKIILSNLSPKSWANLGQGLIERKTGFSPPPATPGPHLSNLMLVFYFVLDSLVGNCWERADLLEFCFCCFAQTLYAVLFVFLPRMMSGEGSQLYQLLIIALSSTFHFVKVCFQIKVQIWRNKWSMNYKIWMQKVVSGLSRQVVSQYRLK